MLFYFILLFFLFFAAVTTFISPTRGTDKGSSDVTESRDVNIMMAVKTMEQ